MKKAIELARSRERRTDELAAEATYARERYDLYKAKAYGPRMTSPARMRTLKQAADLADLRLRRAQEAPDPDAGEAPESLGEAALRAPAGDAAADPEWPPQRPT